MISRDTQSPGKSKPSHAADLTELGLLEQPHTSAGRIPSAAGYRLYVNELMDRHQLTLQETERINQALNVKMEELDRVIDRAGKVLSQISDYPVFTAATVKDQVTVKRYDLLVVEERAFIAVVMTDNSVVKNKLVHMAEPVSDTQIQLLSAVLNSSFVGVSREEMEQTLDKMETRLDILSRLHTTFRYEENILRHHFPQPHGVIDIHRKVFQIPVIDTDDPGTGFQCHLYFLLIMGFHQCRQSKFSCDSRIL